MKPRPLDQANRPAKFGDIHRLGLVDDDKRASDREQAKKWQRNEKCPSKHARCHARSFSRKARMREGGTKGGRGSVRAALASEPASCRRQVTKGGRGSVRAALASEPASCRRQVTKGGRGSVRAAVAPDGARSRRQVTKGGRGSVRAGLASDRAARSRNGTRTDSPRFFLRHISIPNGARSTRLDMASPRRC